jgi:hypothetical protein
MEMTHTPAMDGEAPLSLIYPAVKESLTYAIYSFSYHEHETESYIFLSLITTMVSMVNMKMKSYIVYL